MIKNILLSNMEIEASHRDYRRVMMINLLYFLTLLTFIIFSPINFFLKESHIAGAVEFLFILPVLYGVFQLRRDKNIQKSAIFATYMLFFMILSVLYLFKFDEYIVIWAFLFPFIAISLCGIKTGLIFIIVFNIFVYIGIYYFWHDMHVSEIVYLRVIAVSVIITFLVYFYEKNISESFYKQLELNQSLKNRIEELKKLSTTDSLTKLFNKRHFDTILFEEFNRAKRANSNFTLAIIDVDNFKLYNDTYGHDKGNSALIKIGKVLNEQTMRSGDYAFRIGGEEFAIILQSQSNTNVHSYFDNLREKIMSEKIVHKKNIPFEFLTISIGVVSVNSYEMIGIMDLYRMADKKLYEVKRSTRNSIKVITI